MKVDGRCLCGHLRYEAEVDPDRVCICSCTDCQTLSGSAFRVTAPVVNDSFTLLSGAVKTYAKVAESGRRRVLGFCPQCGTSIYSRPPDGGSGYFGLRVGALSQRASLVPKIHYWRRSAQHWIDHINDLQAVDAE
jgi:hypothetical protein